MKVVTRIGVVFCAVVMSVVIGAGSATAIPLPVLPPLPEPFATWFKPPEPLDKKLAKSYAALTKSMRKSLPGQLGRDHRPPTAGTDHDDVAHAQNSSNPL